MKWIEQISINTPPPQQYFPITNPPCALKSPTWTEKGQTRQSNYIHSPFPLGRIEMGVFYWWAALPIMFLRVFNGFSRAGKYQPHQHLHTEFLGGTSFPNEFWAVVKSWAHPVQICDFQATPPKPRTKESLAWTLAWIWVSAHPYSSAFSLLLIIG